MYDIIEMGKKMRQKRKELNLTLDDIAETVKVAKSTIQRYEAAKIESPMLRQMSKALHMSLFWERLRQVWVHGQKTELKII